MKKKKIQIFYGGFIFKKGGVNSNSITLKEELQKNFDVSLYSLDSLPLFFRFFPHFVEKVVNLFFLPLGFFYKDVCTGFLFKFFFNKKNTDYRIFQDINLSWNSNVPSVTMLHAIWSDNLQKYDLKKEKILELKKKEIKKINFIKHDICTVSYPYKKFILKEHFFNKIKKKIKVVELGIKNLSVKKNKKIKKSLIYVGSLEKRKNVLFLINIFHKLYEYDKRYSLTIVGTGPEEFQLKKIAKSLELPIKFLGSKNSKEILNELKKHSIYVHTSIKESFSLSLLEAKMSGLATVSYKYLQIPRDFIDYGVDEFKENKWFKKIIDIKEKNTKFKYKKYLIGNMVNKLLRIAN
jgi:glycosyltransferase involved in cell wall biosynthesis